MLGMPSIDKPFHQLENHLVTFPIFCFLFFSFIKSAPMRAMMKGFIVIERNIRFDLEKFCSKTKKSRLVKTFICDSMVDRYITV